MNRNVFASPRKTIILVGCMIALVSGLAAVRAQSVLSAILVNQGNLVLLRNWNTSNDPSPWSRCPDVKPEQTSINAFRKAIALNSTNERAWLGHARASWLNGDCLAAGESWNMALRLNPADTIVVFDQGLWNYSYGYVDSALRKFRTVNASRYFWMSGEHAAKSVDQQAALPWYKLSIMIKPERATVQSLADTYRASQPGEAERLWELLVEASSPQYSDYWWARGQIAEMNQDWPAALDAYRQSLALEVDLHNRFLTTSQAGHVSQLLGNYDEAKRYFTLAYQLEPGAIWPYLNLGYLALAQRQSEEGLRWCQTAESVDPQSEFPNLCQGRALWEQGKKDQALQTWRNAEKKNPQSAEVKHQLATAEYTLGNVPAAIDYIRQAIALPSDKNIEWQYILGDWYSEAKRCSEAIQVYQQILRQRPQDVVALDSIEKVKATCR